MARRGMRACSGHPARPLGREVVRRQSRRSSWQGSEGRRSAGREENSPGCAPIGAEPLSRRGWQGIARRGARRKREQGSGGGDWKEPPDGRARVASRERARRFGLVDWADGSGQFGPAHKSSFLYIYKPFSFTQKLFQVKKDWRFEKKSARISGDRM
jgi:hypothetical protein